MIIVIVIYFIFGCLCFKTKKKKKKLFYESALRDILARCDVDYKVDDIVVVIFL